MMYSGEHMIGLLDRLTLKNGNSMGNKIEIYTPICTRGSCILVGANCSMFGLDIKINTIIKLKSLEDTIIESRRKINAKHYREDLPMIIFDHKVAGEFSTYPQIYLDGYINKDKSFGSLLTNNPSRHKIDELEELYKQWSN